MQDRGLHCLVAMGYGRQNGDRIGMSKFYGSENVFREQLVDCCGYGCLRALNRVWTLLE
jgi:hypothetical protein